MQKEIEYFAINNDKKSNLFTVNKFKIKISLIYMTLHQNIFSMICKEFHSHLCYFRNISSL